MRRQEKKKRACGCETKVGEGIRVSSRPSRSPAFQKRKASEMKGAGSKMREVPFDERTLNMAFFTCQDRASNRQATNDRGRSNNT